MKKILVLLTVMALATAANAAIISSTQGSLFKMEVSAPSATVTTGDTVTVGIFAGSDSPVGAMLFTKLNVSSASSIGAITQGTASSWGAYLGSTAANGSGFDINVDGVITAPIPANSSIYSFTFVAGPAGIVTLDAVSGTWDTYDAAVGPADGFYEFGAIYGLPYAQISVAAVPEPATMALLGLGGLWLRRRK